ncbi:hypothetical protein [Clostridium sp. E02]|uniref:hypothetical protein n=1 Tax=Clostridium sp. E02 TaxID=2487134 RepID=UPI0019D29B8F|nr:hypothetical protein [Clostridium sp. E02]
MAVEYGTIGIRPRGEWDPDTKYDLLNLVVYDGSSYVAHTAPPKGTLPTDTAYWQVSAQGTGKATADSVGTIKPDGTTTEVSTDGALSVKQATQTTAGIVKGSEGIKVGEEGSIDVNTQFTQATELANIIAGEAIAEVLGKVSKSIATTMNLDQNALLKNMLTSIDVNDSNKVPNSALIHTLIERIGMGTELTAGANLTAAFNALNSDLGNIGTFQTSFAINKTIPSSTKDWLCDWLTITPGTYLVGFTSQPMPDVDTYLKITDGEPTSSTSPRELFLVGSGSATKIIKVTSNKYMSVVINNRSSVNYIVYSDPSAYFAWALRLK